VAKQAAGTSRSDRNPFAADLPVAASACRGDDRGCHLALTIWLYRIAGTDPAHQIEAIKTGLTVAAGTGGAFGLLLAFRRQRSTELALVSTDRDATERRITELYIKAADQLGSDQAPVRLAGLYALERLAHSNIEHRRTIVDVICAYLRMPYTPPRNLQRARSGGPTAARD
jgi:hypothetical protein